MHLHWRQCAIADLGAHQLAHSATFASVALTGVHTSGGGGGGGDGDGRQDGQALHLHHLPQIPALHHGAQSSVVESPNRRGAHAEPLSIASTSAAVHIALHTRLSAPRSHGAPFTPRVLLLGRVNIMIFATFALGFFCPRHACEERDCGGRCSNETISLRCADTEVIRLVLLQTADDITGDTRDVMSGEVSSGDVDNPAGFCNATRPSSRARVATGPCAAHLLAAANAASVGESSCTLDRPISLEEESAGLCSSACAGLR